MPAGSWDSNTILNATGRMASRMASTPKPCAFFLKGQCTRGNDCHYSHTTPVRETRGLSDTPKPFFASQPCKFFQQGTCTNPNCPFVHTFLGSRRDTVITTLAEGHSQVSANHCRFHLQGRCQNGDSCRFYHAPRLPSFEASPLAIPPKQSRKVAIQHPLSRPTVKSGAIPENDVPPFLPVPTDVNESESLATVTRTVHACKVTLGPGFQVQSVSTDLESTRVVVSNLPGDITDADLERILSIFGEVCVHLLRSAIRPMALADYDTTDAASLAMTTLDQSTYRERTLTARLEPRASDGEMGVLRDTTVKVAWFAPSSIAYAHYTSIKRAKEASRRRNGESLLGRKISAQMQPPSIRQTESFTVIITGLSPDINEQHLCRFMACDTVTMRPPRFDAATGVRRLKASLDINDGSLESFDVQDHAPGDVKMKGLARYSSVRDAKDAVLVLNGEKMDYLNGSAVWLSHLQSVKFAMPRLQYVALEPRITALQRSANTGDKELRWTVFDRASDGTPAPIVTVRIYGDDIPSLGKMKVKMETLLLGDVIKVDNESIWDDHLLSVEGYSAISDLAQSVGAYARCDPVRHHLALYGSGIACTGARTLILAEVSRMQTRRHVIGLDPETFSRLVRTGLAQLRAQYGAEHIGLDLVHRHLLVRVDHPSQLAAIRTFLPQMEQLVASSNSSVECPVCTCDVSDAIILSCTHEYCGSCLDLLLESSSTFPVICLAENCGTPIPIPVFKARLTPPKVDALLDKAAKAYINEHPNEFKFCPSPDCVHVYRPGPEGSAIQCKGCLAHICPACHVVAHAGLTCAERRLESDPAERAYRRWKVENQVKPCPHCGMDIQKSAGCNHMTCAACKTHMCWVCMATFPDGGRVYNHMTKTHGGFGLEGGL